MDLYTTGINQHWLNNSKLFSWINQILLTPTYLITINQSCPRAKLFSRTNMETGFSDVVSYLQCSSFVASRVYHSLGVSFNIFFSKLIFQWVYMKKNQEIIHCSTLFKCRKIIFNPCCLLYRQLLCLTWTMEPLYERDM